MDTTNTLRNVYVWSTLPREWMCREMFTGIVACGENRDEAVALFRHIWNDRAPYTLVEHSPPRQKRQDAPASDDDPKDSAATIYRRLVAKYHPDRSPESAAVMRDINSLYQALRRQK
jgi:hypothetical protein